MVTDPFKKIEINLKELNILETYIRANTIYKSPVPVPAFIELADVKTSFIIDELILESTKLEFLKDKVKSDFPLSLTLDSNLQHLIREELISAQKIFNPIGRAAVLMNVDNGEILSLVSSTNRHSFGCKPFLLRIKIQLKN